MLGRSRTAPAASVTIVTTTPNSGFFVDNASVSGDQADSSGGNNQAALNTTVNADFLVEIVPSSVTLVVGGIAEYTVTVGALIGPFVSDVSMTCSITPALDCGLGTTSVVPGPDPSSPSVFALGIVTVGNSARLSPKSRNHGIVACSFLVLPGIAFCIAGFWQDKSQKRVPYQRVVIVLLMFLALQPACGGEGGRGSGGGSQHHGTPAGTYQITMTGVSGAIQHSATASLVVQ
jgi:hypothetical protein